MSTYYDYYLGIKKEDGEIYPIGPYKRRKCPFSHDFGCMRNELDRILSNG